ncbi:MULTISPECIES: helix-turn-helix domain-containing protein [Metabacillus]|uniref:Transcriptional regulator n=1 Tax=Metabacillus indicus TaxID=246786 RepID=A0A084H4I5_METID|nr:MULTISPECIES: helix-turn-helix domain-containing protein [Metabacillus]KEZ50341.1 transcriptional regulator [Metabacillus indicus LMG 22858]KEZ54497.1 transcriptional regulator [Metabacillus indicus]
MVGDQIRELRLEKGYSISELADLAGVSKSYLSYIERNIQKNPSLQFLKKIAFTLEVDLDTLIDEKDQETIPIDDEWKELLGQAIAEGLSKEQFKDFQEYVKFQKWKHGKKQIIEFMDDNKPQ